MAIPEFGTQSYPVVALLNIKETSFFLVTMHVGY